MPRPSSYTYPKSTRPAAGAFDWAAFLAKASGRALSRRDLPDEVREAVDGDGAALRDFGYTVVTPAERSDLLAPGQMLLWPLRPGKAAVARMAGRSERGRRREPESHQKAIGQYMTPPEVADFMASFFAAIPAGRSVRVLDPGAGCGNLSCAFLRWLNNGGSGMRRVRLDAFDVDTDMAGRWRQAFEQCAGACPRLAVEGALRVEDFIVSAVAEQRKEDSLWRDDVPAGYTHCIMNPPYHKLGSGTVQSLALKSIGIEVPNLYAAFLALGLLELIPGGELVAIIPRSFCNGVYYAPFRRFLFEHAAIRRIHLFGSRRDLFREGHVLQENVILHLVRGRKQGPVVITTSTDGGLRDLSRSVLPFEVIVPGHDAQQVIRIPISHRGGEAEPKDGFAGVALSNLGIAVSTGPIVSFRIADCLLDRPSQDGKSVPLVQSRNFTSHGCVWPRPDLKKPSALKDGSAVRKGLFPAGYYTVVRRLSAKEEPRRIVAHVVSPDDFPGVAVLGFENHLNVFHVNKHGLPEDLAYGLAIFLNSSRVDAEFRQFSGHTQVNAADLRRLRFPSLPRLEALGARGKSCFYPYSQPVIDRLVEECVNGADK